MLLLLILATGSPGNLHHLINQIIYGPVHVRRELPARYNYEFFFNCMLQLSVLFCIVLIGFSSCWELGRPHPARAGQRKPHILVITKPPVPQHTARCGFHQCAQLPSLGSRARSEVEINSSDTRRCGEKQGQGATGRWTKQPSRFSVEAHKHNLSSRVLQLCFYQTNNTHSIKSQRSFLVVVVYSFFKITLSSHLEKGLLHEYSFPITAALRLPKENDNSDMVTILQAATMSP